MIRVRRRGHPSRPAAVGQNAAVDSDLRGATGRSSRRGIPVSPPRSLNRSPAMIGFAVAGSVLLAVDPSSGAAPRGPIEAEALVERALRAEDRGTEAERQRALEQAVQADPSN